MKTAPTRYTNGNNVYLINIQSDTIKIGQYYFAYKLLLTG